MGRVVINGIDTAQPATPFTFTWGDGSEDEGWFPMTHIYIDPSRDYEVVVTAHYGAVRVSQQAVAVRFVTPDLHPIAVPREVVVAIPTNLVPFGSRVYAAPTGLSAFGDASLASVSRATVEYMLSIAAWIQCEFVNADVYAPDGVFQQVVLRDAASGGMYSLWFTTPPSFAAGDYAFQGSPQYSSFFHEMGHNVTLNSPAAFCYGGKIDGSANAIFSEAMAQIFAHATAYEIINCADAYGLSPALVDAVKQSAIDSHRLLKSGYEAYLAVGHPFASWNDPGTDVDETLDTFMTIAYVFCQHADQAGQGFRGPVQRMMRLLQTFDSKMEQEYSPDLDSPAAESFRATLMVAAASYGLNQDLRGVFRDLDFPVSDEVYANLLQGLP